MPIRLQLFLEGEKMNKKIYLASRFGRQSFLRNIRDQLHDTGKWTVVSRWIDTERPENPDKNFFLSDDGMSRLNADLADIRLCNIMVADLTEGMGTRGGVAIEIGYAIGLKKPVILIGKPEMFGIFGHVFHKTFSDWQTAFAEYF